MIETKKPNKKPTPYKNPFAEGIITFREDTYVPEPAVIRVKRNNGNKEDKTQTIRTTIDKKKEERVEFKKEKEKRLVKPSKTPVSLHFKAKKWTIMQIKP